MKGRAHIFIEGNVQGVFYRSWTHKTAKELGLNGFVNNMEDGRVEALFEGDKEKVSEMVEKCKQGSEASKVTHIDVIWEEPKEDYNDFVVK